MDKLLKFLMLLLATTLSLTFTACGGDDDEPNNPDDISIVGKLNTVTVGVEGPAGHGVKFKDVTVDVGCQVHLILDEYGNGGLYSSGFIVYAGDFTELKSITTAPLRIPLRNELFHNGGCYIIKSDTGAYIRFKVELNEEHTAATFQFQTFKPSNIQ